MTQKTWINIQEGLLTAGKETLKLMKKSKHEWITDEILCSMENRRKHKNRNIQYKNMNIENNMKIREEWLHEKCREMEEYV